LQGSNKKSNLADQKAFKKLVTELYKAWESQDVSKPSRFYSKDPDHVFFDFAPIKYTGWKEYAAGVKKTFFDNMPPNASRLAMKDDFKVMRWGNVAVTHSTIDFSARLKNGTKMKETGRHTAVWEKHGPRWQIVHDHWSFPAK